jgi:hypothetical protein
MVGTMIKVISTGENCWRVHDEFSGKFLSDALQKSEAVETARRIAKDRGAEFIVIREDATVELAEEYEWGVEAPELDTARHTIAIPTVSVVQDEDMRWLVEGDQPNEILNSFGDKDDAIAFARPAAVARKAHLIVHQPNGSIEWTEDYAWAEGER